MRQRSYRRIPTRFTAFMFCPTGLPIEIFPTIPLAAEAALDTIAAPKLNQLKDSSVSDARATPPITGNRLKYTGKGRNCFNTIADNAAETLKCHY